MPNQIQDRDLTIYAPNGSVAWQEERSLTLDELSRLWKTGANVNFGSGHVSAISSFRNQSIVFACVDRIATVSSSVPIVFRSRSTGEILTQSTTGDLFRTPCHRQSGLQLIYSTAAFKELTGNAVWWLDFGVGGPRPNMLPGRIVSLAPQSVRVLTDPTGENIVAYEYKQAKTGRPIMFEPAEIFHTRYFNPTDRHWGQSPAQAALRTIRVDVKSTDYAESFFDNSAQVSGVLIHKQRLTQKQIEDIRRDIKARHTGIEQAHGMLTLAGDWDYQQLGSTMKDMAFPELRRFAREEIASAFNVPNILLNNESKVPLATARILLRLFRETKWGPLLRQLAADIDSQILMPYAPDVTVEFDLSNALGSGEDLGEKVSALSELVDRGLSLNKAIRFLELPIEPEPWGDQYLVNQNVVPASTITGTDAQTKGAPRPAERSVEQQELPIQTRTYDDEKLRALYWGAFADRLESLTKPMERSIRSFFFALRSETLRNLANEDELRTMTRDAADDFAQRVVFDLDKASQRIKEVVRPHLKKAMEEGGQMVLFELNVDGTFSISSSFAVTSFERRVNLTSPKIPETVFNQVLEQLREAVTKGETLNDLADRLRDGVFRPSANRARTIARTEVATAVNHGRVASMKEQKVTSHEWLSSRDDHVRPKSGPGKVSKGVFDHNIDREVVKIDEEFSIGLKFPLDDTGSNSVAGNVINCRCTSIPRTIAK